MFEPFFLRALAASIIVAVLAGPIGCLMIWRKMAYFSDTLSHGALTGVLLGVVTGMAPNAGVCVFVCLLALILFYALKSKVVEIDLLLLIVGQTALCVGWVFLSLFDTIRSDMTAYLFGDVLSVTGNDLYFMAVAGVLCLVLLKKCWKNQIFAAVAPDIAQVEGVAVARQTLVFMILTALFVSVAFKTTGLLLVASLLVILPATASLFASTPEKAAVFSSALGVVCVTAGLVASYVWDVPAAPAMEICCAILFFSVFIGKARLTA